MEHNARIIGTNNVVAKGHLRSKRGRNGNCMCSQHGGEE